MLKPKFESTLQSDNNEIIESNDNVINFNVSCIENMMGAWKCSIKTVEGQLLLTINHNSWNKVNLEVPDELHDYLFESKDGLFYEIRHSLTVNDLGFSIVDLLVYNINCLIVADLDIKDHEVASILRWMGPMVSFNIIGRIQNLRNNTSTFKRKKYSGLYNMLARENIDPESIYDLGATTTLDDIQSLFEEEA